MTRNPADALPHMIVYREALEGETNWNTFHVFLLILQSLHQKGKEVAVNLNQFTLVIQFRKGLEQEIETGEK
jgi:hypothetical protein